MNLSGKTVLLLAPKFFGYELEIKKELENLGARVIYFDERPKNDFFTKVFIRLNLKYFISKKIKEYYQDIENACLILGENPNIGKPYSEINDNLFGLVSGKHIIFYQIAVDKEIEVIRILHEQMDIESRLTD